MTHLGIALLWLCWRLLPQSGLAWLGRRLGDLLYPLAGARRRIAATNLRLCFPELSDAERRRLLRAHFRYLGQAVMLESIIWWGTREDIERLVTLRGVEHLEAQTGRAVILLAPHFVGLTLGGVRVAVHGVSMVNMYAAMRNKTLERIVLHSRLRFGHGIVHSRHEGIKPVLRAMKQGHPFHYSPDLDYGRRDAIFVPFFHTPAATVTSLPRIAHGLNAAVLPIVTRVQGDGFVTEILPAWDDFPGPDVETDVKRMNAFIETRIRAMPAQYFWVHKRFKTRPEGEPSVYG